MCLWWRALEWTATCFLEIRPSLINFRTFCLLLAFEISVCSLGSSQTFLEPQLKIEDASLCATGGALSIAIQPKTHKHTLYLFWSLVETLISIRNINDKRKTIPIRTMYFNNTSRITTANEASQLHWTNENTYHRSRLIYDIWQIIMITYAIFR